MSLALVLGFKSTLLFAGQFNVPIPDYKSVLSAIFHQFNHSVAQLNFSEIPNTSAWILVWVVSREPWTQATAFIDSLISFPIAMESPDAIGKEAGIETGKGP